MKFCNNKKMSFPGKEISFKKKKKSSLMIGFWLQVEEHRPKQALAQISCSVNRMPHVSSGLPHSRVKTSFSLFSLTLAIYAFLITYRHLSCWSVISQRTGP